MARITSQITLANSGGTSAVANLTKGSYASINTQDGPNTVTIDLAGTWSQTGGLSVLFVPLQSPSVTTEPVQTIPQSALTARSNGNTSGITSAVQDTFTLGINGAGTLYVISGSATFSGPVTITLGQALGAPSNQIGGGGGSVNAYISNTNALPQSATYVKASSAGTPITTATTVQMLAAAGAGLYYHVWVHFLNLGNTATEVQILDGSTVIYDSGAVANGGGLNDPVPIPLIGSANTALSIKTLTAGASLVWNVRGYSFSVI